MALTVAAAGLAIVTACREAQSPTGTLPLPAGTVTIVAAQASDPSLLADASGRQWLRCNEHLAARSSASREAVWLDAQFVFYTSADSTTPFAVDTVPASTVATSWSAPTIEPDSSRYAMWTLTASVPFTVRMRFLYQMTGGPVDTAMAAASCVPALPSGSPPTITTFSIPAYTSLQPGDTLHLSYAATSTVGLWQTVIGLSGPCDTSVAFAEQLKDSVSRQVNIALPTRCALGVQPTLTATVWDGRVQGATQKLILAALTDTRPPTVTVSMTSSHGAAPASGPWNLFAGDTISLVLTATDNYLVHTLYWEIDPVGVRDSALLRGVSVARSLTIPLPNAWTGPLQIKAWARDSAGNVSDTVSSAPGAIAVYPTVSPAAGMTAIAGDVTDVAFDGKRGVLYLLQGNAQRIAIFSPASHTVVRTIALPAIPSAFDLTQSLDTIVAVFDTPQAFGIVDLTQSTPAVQMVPFTHCCRPLQVTDLRIGSNGRILISAGCVGCLTPDAYILDPAADTLIDRLAGGAIERTPDASAMVFNGPWFRRYDIATNAFSFLADARTQYVHPEVDGTAAHVAVGGDLYDSTLQYVRTVSVAASVPQGPAAMSPDGRTHYMAVSPYNTGIYRSRVSDGSPIDRIPANAFVTQLKLSPDGATLAVVACPNTCRIGVVTLSQLH